jgi:exosome complex RNA-binding protein Csl4
MNLQRMSRLAATAVFAATISACAGTGGLGSILGGVLGGIGGNSSNQVSGSVQSVDTRNQQVIIAQSNGQQVALSYDNSTNVVFNNSNYPVTSLERGDQVTARIQQLQNGSYYTDLIQVDQSVSGTNGGLGNQLSYEGTVRQVNVQNGWFTMDTNNSGRITVTVPYNARSNDVTRFQNLRIGDYVRIYGTVSSQSQVVLSQFY